MVNLFYEIYIFGRKQLAKKMKICYNNLVLAIRKCCTNLENHLLAYSFNILEFQKKIPNKILYVDLSIEGSFFEDFERWWMTRYEF